MKFSSFVINRLITTSIFFSIIALPGTNLSYANMPELAENNRQQIVQNGVDAIKKKQYADALKLGTFLVKRNGHDYDGYHLCGIALKNIGKYLDLVSLIISAEKMGVTSLSLFQIGAEASFDNKYYGVTLAFLEKYEELWQREENEKNLFYRLPRT